MNIVKKYWFSFLFVVGLCLPLYGGVLEEGVELSGVSAPLNKVVATFESCGDGSYQNYLSSTWENDFPGRKICLKLRNQILYSVFSVSPNSNVVIGKDEQLFEPSYILLETQAMAPQSEEYFEGLGEKLKKLDALLKKSQKELYVFITPSKAHFYYEYIPDKYLFMSNKEQYNYTNYSQLLETLNESEIAYFDSVEYMEMNRNTSTIKSPLFFRTGIHWSNAWGKRAAAEFLNYMNTSSKYDLSTVRVTEIESDIPVAPDTDLYSSLNLIVQPKDNWYATHMVIDDEGADKPNVFFRGGSFMFQSLNALVATGVFGKDVHLGNNKYFLNRYTESYTLSDYTAYDEMDLDTLMGQSDILILEVNEGMIHNMSFGFIDYLLEHEEYLD